MDEYEIKFAEMQKYIPFLEKMIERLQNVTDRSREDQLKKMQQLHGILTSSRRHRLKIEVLQKCEVVLQKLYKRMGKFQRASAGVNAGVRGTREHSSSPSDVSASTNQRKSEQPSESQKVMSSKKMDETPASPSPPASPDMTNKSSVTCPIMIPTERTNDYSDKMDSKPASPDESETVATKEPIIIPTERKDGWSEQSQQNATPHNSSRIASSGSHKSSETRSHPRSILSVTNSSSSSRRISSAEKTRVEGTCSDDVPEVIEIDSPKQTRLTSPETRNIPKKNPTSLLASPPPELNAPPLSMEDLAELLDENTDSDKITASHREKENRNRSVKERIQEDSSKPGNERKLNRSSVSDYTNSDVESERRWEEVDKHIVKLTTRKSLPSASTTAVMGARIEAPKADSMSSSSSNPSKLNSGDSRNVPVSPSTKSSERNAEPRYTDNYERYPRHSREPQSDTQNISMPDMNVIKSAFSNLSEGDIANLVQTNLQIRTNNFLHTDDRNPTFQRRTDQHQQRPGPSHIGSLEPEFRREHPEFYDVHQQTPKHHPPGAVGYPANTQWSSNPNMRGHMHGPELSPRQYQHANNVSHPDMWKMAANPVPLDGHPHHHVPNQFGPVPNRGMRSMMSPQTDRPYAEDMPLSPPPPPPPALIPSLMASPTFPPNSQYRGFPPENRPFERTGEFQHGQSRQQWEHQPNRSNDPTFDRSGEYSHIPPGQSQWQSPTNRPSEGLYDRSTDCPQPEFPLRPNQWEHESNYHDSSRLRGLNDNCYGRTSNVEPPLWGRNSVPEASNRNSERGRGNERFPNERNRPSETIHSNFSRSRPSEWDRPPQNDSSNRYRDRDPRCRTEPIATQSTNVPSASIPRRDPRLSKDIPAQSPAVSKTKDPPASTPIAKPKDPPTISKRDPRRKSVEMKDSHKLKNPSKPSHKSRSRSIDRSKELTKHSSGKTKKDSLDHKSSSEKPTKDVETMQSPLESLYGVIDTTAKTGKGYGLQKFKIPKIRRTESVVPRPPTPPKPSRHAVDEEEWTTEPSARSASPKTDSSVRRKNNSDEKKAEVTSTTEEITDSSVPVKSTEVEHDPRSSDVVTTSKELPVQSIENKKGDDKIDTPKTAVDTSTLTKTPGPGIDTSQETQLKDSVTQELIEALIRKSLESGEAKKLFEQAKLLQQLVDPKKYKKIEKIINGDSESGSSCEEGSTIKKSVTKKKRRVIVSDSSDEECLADRLGITKNKARKRKAVTKEIANEDKVDVEKNETEQIIDDEDGTTNEVGNALAKKPKKSKKAKTKKSTETVEEPEEPKEVPTKPPTRTAKKRRNSLEMLQEDIREMFISEGVVTATGHRMCRVMKEAESTLSSITGDSKTDTGSVYASSSPDRQNDIQTDEDEASPKVSVRGRGRPIKNSDVEASPKTKLKSRKGRRRATKVSKDVILSSDSEAERTTRDATAADSDTSVATVKNSSLNQSMSSLPDASDDFGPVLRRSERVAMKEPRVLIEKADLSKIDSSKIMFDTSSDESFGIDVSELTAAVDISLHSERQSTDDGGSSITGSLKKIPDKAMRSRKKNSNESSDSKRDALVAFDDDISMTSDISTLSGIVSNVSKKITSTSSHEDTNKELIGDILGNLSDEKVKQTINTNSGKHSDIEGDEEKDVSAADDNRKPQSKVKKKRCRWQMGFVPKCKKKKSGNSSITETTMATLDKNSASSLGDNEVEGASVVSTTEAALNSNEADSEKSITEKLNLLSKSVHNDSTRIKDEKESSVSQTKTERKASEVYESLGLNEVIEYAWTGQERYKCLLCQFSGKNIVHHYKINHPDEEIMISRLTLLDARRAIDEAKDETFIKLSRKVNSGPRRKFSCRFCVFTNEGVKKPAMESFYEHCTTHTGEYRFSCKSCGYQTISRASMKPHYYKVCRKSAESFAIAIAEDAIPSDQYISGYLCSVCNYIQLKECNVQMHVSTIHKHLSDVEIIKINMSGYFDVKYNEELNHPIDEAISLKVESDISFDKETEPDSRVQDNEKDEDNSDVEILDKTADEVREVSLKLNESALKIVQDDGDNLPSNKLNAFVCPPELEDKEVEIELERKKKMQEILNNMGRNFQKPLSGGGLSIIDKLKNKMTTDMNNSELARVEVDDDEEPSIIEDTGETSELPPGEMSQSSHQLEEHDKDPKSEPDDKDPTSVSTTEGEKLKDLIPAGGDEGSDKIEKKMKDPLTSLQNDERKDDDTEHEGSDNEPIANAGRSYESDSSDEMTDTELPTDVHSLLEAAGTINTSTTNVPMMTTIQRLAAQLQSAKNFTAVNNDNIDEGRNHEDQETMGDEASQDAAVDSPINAMNPNPTDSRNDPSISVAAPPVQIQAEDGRKNFIRLRRLSGDKLSIPEPSSAPRSPTTENSPLSANESTTDLLSNEVLRSSTDDDCSFLKIENVVSLAPATTNISEVSPAGNDMRATVTASTGKTIVSVLKKLRPVGAIEGLLGRLPPIAPAPPKCFKLSNIPTTKNVKIVKILNPAKPLRELTTIKQRDSGQISSAPKLKTVDAYNNMLSASKLRHLYKCMGRSCEFTSDSVEAFGRHYQYHANTVDRSTASPPYDFEKCAYCSESLSTWDDMRAHFKLKHTFCSFQCSYCFYRAFTQSYVELHQSSSHPGKPTSVILGMKDYHPSEMIDKREHVIPIVCKHECNKIFYVPEAFVAHLRSKHGPTLSIFKCHICPTTTLKAEQLISHYKLHSIYKYQCLYCLFGADGPMELHHHLSLMHFNRPPKILERSLPPEPARDKDVLLQLIIRNLDATFKCSELKIISDSSSPDNVSKSLSKRRKRSGPTPTPGELVLAGGGKSIKILPGPVKLVGHEVIDLLDPGDKSCPQRSNIFLNLADTLRAAGSFSENKKLAVVKIDSKTASESLSKPSITVRLNENPINEERNTTDEHNVPAIKSTEQLVVHHEPELELRYASEQLKCKVANAIDPLRLSESDEFININFLDNPEILKSVEQFSVQKDNCPNKIVEMTNDDDSDIEILEHIQHTDDNSRNKSVPTTVPEVDRPVPVIDKENEEEEKKEFVTSEKRMEVVCGSAEDSNNSGELNVPIENADVKGKFHGPLTLNDIKDTGFTGRDLYKCGYSECTFSTLLANGLKNHIKQCVHANERKEFSCIHCSKRFVKIAYLLEHFKIHGLKRFGCSLCSSRFAIPHQAISHMKFRHKIHNSKLMPADPTNPSADGLFVIHPHKGVLQKYRGKKGGKSKSSDKKRGKEENTTFSPTEIDALPRQPIYNREVQCAICPYKTKVRSNIIRHLQLHAKDETVPESGPVNPVPCLDKKERMFDKMVNLASSSHQNGRMGGTVKETITASESDGLPKYVPEQKRYVCGVADCNYLTVDETMLRYHSKALHPDEVNFRCPHCPSQSPGQEAPQTIPIDKMGVHLKMHDTRLYKCSHCNHHHYHRHVVERHMTDKHAEQRPYVKIIREIENTENSQPSPAQEEPEEGPADRDGNYWKCNLCDYKCVYKSEMVIHAGSVHNEKAQFKCSLCVFKTTARISLEQHIMSKHVNDSDCTYLLTFERIKGPKPTATESTQNDEPFDTTPLWRRDMPRIRHIRGILLEEEGETSRSTDTPTKSGKRKSDGELATKPAKIKVKSMSFDGSNTIENKGKSETKSEWVDNTAGTSPTTALSLSNQATDIPQMNTEGLKPIPSDSTEAVSGLGKAKYGAYVEPNGNFYVCSLCPNYKSKFRQDMKDHLYRELKYWRLHCKTCGFLTVSQSLLTKHINRQHKDRKPEYVAIKPNPEIESWVQTFLSKQLAVMRGVTKSVMEPVPTPPASKSSLSRNEVKGKPPMITLEDIIEVPVEPNKSKTIPSILASSVKKTMTESPSAMPSSTITTTETAKTVDLTEAISSLQAINSTQMSIDSDDDDDGDALVIDSKDDPDEEIKDVISDIPDLQIHSNELEVPEKNYVCKHCDMKFSRWRGFKLHVQVNHLKRLGFLCPYCDRSTNSEPMMRQHIRTKHIGRPEHIVHNPAAGGPELSDTFWEQEYGLIRPKRIKKRKLKQPYSDSADPPEDTTEKNPTAETCPICGFSALNFTGLKVHMRAHANKHSLKCVHCSFTTNSKSEVWQHSEINHPNVEWRAQEINSAGSSEGQPIHQYTKSVGEEDYSEDIEEEPIPESFEHKLIHGCFYCNLRSASLDSVKKHWALVHKELKESSEHKTGVPFRYKEIPVRTISQHKLMKCAYCPKKGSLTMLRAHCRKKHSNVPLKFTEAIDRSQDIWVCKWCNESCEANTKTAHHTMFHSHLPVRFRKEHDMQVMQKGYVCPECSFVSVSLSRMKTHVAKHYDTFRCKRCDGSFASIVLATQHSTREHPGLSANIEGFATNIDLIMARVSETDCAGIVSNTTDDMKPTASNDIFRNLGVAKKSTTKQIIRSPSTSPSKSVARKSTNPLPRYPPGLVFDIDNILSDSEDRAVKSISYYGLPIEPVELSNLNTTMVVGSAQMKVKCNTLAQIINIEPRVILEDINKIKK